MTKRLINGRDRRPALKNLEKVREKNATSHFLCLPPELRNNIYELALVPQTNRNLRLEYMKSPVMPPLLSTCCQTRKEVASIFLDSVNIHICGKAYDSVYGIRIPRSLSDTPRSILEQAQHLTVAADFHFVSSCRGNIHTIVAVLHKEKTSYGIRVRRQPCTPDDECERAMVDNIKTVEKVMMDWARRKRIAAGTKRIGGVDAWEQIYIKRFFKVPRIEVV